jgi:hypothetical protein
VSNKITTLGYLKKRLKDCGYNCIDVFKNYRDTDPRSWTIVIDPGNNSIFCTCYINYPDLGSNYLELYDGGQLIPGKIKIQTSSFEVFVEYLNKLDIYNKSLISNTYNK